MSAAASRLCLAVALSATLHGFLIYGIALRPTAGDGRGVSVISARISIPEPESPPRAPGRSRPASALHAPGNAAQPPQPAPLHQPGNRIEPVVDAGQGEETPPEPALSVADLPDPVHYPAKELDVYPQPVNRITPPYPEAPLRLQIGGSVILLVLIDETGRVTDVSVVDATPEGVFEESALQGMHAAAFLPAQKGGRAVRSRILVTVDFDPAADAGGK